MLFLVLVVGGGLSLGYVTAPASWYANLQKPWFTPPGWVFAPVWTVLYIVIAVAGWRVWRRDRSTLAMQLWWGQLLLNFLWSPVFFGAHWVGSALCIILLLLVTIWAFIGRTWRVERTVAWLFLPYALWVAFASILNAGIFVLN